MMVSSVRRLLAAAALSVSLIASNAQSPDSIPGKKGNPPYKVVTSGKQVTIKSSKGIQHVMLWTSKGDRVIEHRDLNAANHSFSIPVNEKVFFLMVGLNNGKIYTEKLAIP